MTDKQNFEKDIDDLSNRPDWRITLQADHIKRLEEQLDQLKAENEELKSLLKVRIEDLCDSCGASSMMPMPCKVYEKILTEIKEIAEKNLNIHTCAFKGCGYDLITNQILQKISECEENDVRS